MINNLIVVISCEKDMAYSLKIRNTDWYKMIKNNDKDKIIFIYGNVSNNFNKKKDDVFIDHKESYDNLSEKVHKAIKYCFSKYNFKRLIKVDSTIVDLDGQDLNRFFWKKNKRYSFEFFKNCYNKGYFNKEYIGLCVVEDLLKKDVEKWLSSKNVKNLDFDKVFAKYKKPTAYYTGKAYSLSYKCCGIISKKDIAYSKYFSKYLGGIEDVFIATALLENNISPQINKKLDLIKYTESIFRL